MQWSFHGPRPSRASLDVISYVPFYSLPFCAWRHHRFWWNWFWRQDFCSLTSTWWKILQPSSCSALTQRPAKWLQDVLRVFSILVSKKDVCCEVVVDEKRFVVPVPTEGGFPGSREKGIAGIGCFRVWHDCVHILYILRSHCGESVKVQTRNCHFAVCWFLPDGLASLWNGHRFCDRERQSFCASCPSPDACPLKEALSATEQIHTNLSRPKTPCFFVVRVCAERGGINRSEHSLVNCNDFCFVFVYAVHNVLLWLSNFTFWDFYFHSDSAPFLLRFLKVHHLFEINLFRMTCVSHKAGRARVFFCPFFFSRRGCTDRDRTFAAPCMGTKWWQRDASLELAIFLVKQSWPIDIGHFMQELQEAYSRWQDGCNCVKEYGKRWAHCEDDCQLLHCAKDCVLFAVLLGKDEKKWFQETRVFAHIETPGAESVSITPTWGILGHTARWRPREWNPISQNELKEIVSDLTSQAGVWEVWNCCDFMPVKCQSCFRNWWNELCDAGKEILFSLCRDEMFQARLLLAAAGCVLYTVRLASTCGQCDSLLTLRIYSNELAKHCPFQLVSSSIFTISMWQVRKSLSRDACCISLA